MPWLTCCFPCPSPSRSFSGAGIFKGRGQSSHFRQGQQHPLRQAPHCRPRLGLGGHELHEVIEQGDCVSLPSPPLHPSASPSCHELTRLGYFLSRHNATAFTSPRCPSLSFLLPSFESPRADGSSGDFSTVRAVQTTTLQLCLPATTLFTHLFCRLLPLEPVRSGPSWSLSASLSLARQEKAALPMSAPGVTREHKTHHIYQ